MYRVWQMVYWLAPWTGQLEGKGFQNVPGQEITRNVGPVFELSYKRNLLTAYCRWNDRGALDIHHQIFI